MVDKEKMLKKITQLLALAGNNSSAEEAQSAIMKAQELMAKYHILESEVQDLNSGEAEATSQLVSEGTSTAWKVALANIITKNFRCNFLLQKGQGFIFIGMKEDLQICISLYNYAASTLDKGMHSLRRKYRKEGLSTEGISGDYANGFIKGLQDKLNEQVKSNDWGLVLVKPEAVVKKTQSFNPKASQAIKSKLSQSGNSSIYHEGYKQGKSCGNPQKQLA